MASILYQRSVCLRGLQSASRSFSTPAHACAAFTTSTQLPKQGRLGNALSQPTITTNSSLLASQRCAPTSIGIRHASSHSEVTSSSHTTSEDILTWDKFFDLRRKRRWINLGCSLVTATGAVGIFAPLLAQQDIDSWGAQISGLDPVIVLGISTFAIAAGGWLCGPSFGTAMFSLWAARRGWNKLIVEKEKSFFARIKRYRADPSASSPQNPIPDYYGEKIASVKDYRRWLKDQKAFNLKKNKNML